MRVTGASTGLPAPSKTVTPSRSQLCELAVLEKDGAARVRHERRDVGGEVVLTRA